MFKFAVVTVLLAYVSRAQEISISGRIIGGSAASMDMFPYQVSIQRNDVHICSGAIFSEKIIATAAHCLQAVTADEIRVRVGSAYWHTGGSLMSVRAFINHEHYNPVTMEHDIAVLRLRYSLNFNTNVTAVAFTWNSPSTAVYAVVSGWGSTMRNSKSLSDNLQYIRVFLWDLYVCSHNLYGYGDDVKYGMFCASNVGQDTCYGDGGSPLVYNKLLIGIASWGYGCANQDYPGVYTETAIYRSWLDEVADQLN